MARSFRTRRPGKAAEACKTHLRLENLEDRTLLDAGIIPAKDPTGLLSIVGHPGTPSKPGSPVLSGPPAAYNPSQQRTPPPPTPTNVLVNDPTEDGTSANDTQSETAITVYGNTVLAAYNDSFRAGQSPAHYTGFSYSTNQGVSFTDGGALPNAASGVGDAGDPVLAHDNQTGRSYLAVLGYANTGITSVYIFRSDDGLHTFLPAVGVTRPNGPSLDKEWMAVDNAPGAGRGNVYLILRDFGGGNGIFLFRSTDQGATFGPSGGVQIASGSGGNVQGAWVAVGPDHAVYAVWYDSSTSPPSIRMRKSTDQGQTFGNPVTITTLQTTGVNGDLGLGGFRSNAFPQALVNPANPNLVYVVYDDKSGSDRANVYFRESTDGGATWGAAVKVNDDTTTRDQWQPSLAVTPDGTHLGVFWYDRRLDPANNLIDRFGAIATINGGTVTFGVNQRISDTSFPPEFGHDPLINPVYMGDYDMAAADNNYFYVNWGDNRDNSRGHTAKNANVRFAKVPIDNTVGSATHFSIAAPDTVLVGQPFSITVSAVDDNGNIDPNYQGTVTFTSSDPAAGLPADYTFTPDDAGVHTFDGLTLSTLGSQTVTATDVDTNSITGVATINVTTPPLFAPAMHFGVGTGPSSLAVGDFNGDGIPDLATANNTANTITILLGNGDGTFRFFASYPAGSVPNAINAADFNGDGILDLAVANATSNNVSIFLGNGDGSFQPAVNYAVGSSPFSAEIADFNGDGIPDIVTANNGSNTVSILLGNGNGTFQPAQSYAVGTAPAEVAIADFNLDGIPDLAVVNQRGNNVTILLGNGDGTFQSFATFAVGLGSQSVFTADFNFDGIPDLVTANFNEGTISVLLGNGDGTFQPQVTYPVGTSPAEVAVADFNGDGIPDVVTANNGSGDVSVLLGNGDGTFTPAQSYAAGNGPFFVAAADLNGDGAPDLAVVNFTANDVSILINVGYSPSHRRVPGLRSDPTLGVETRTAAGPTPVESTAPLRADPPDPFAVDQYLGVALSGEHRDTPARLRGLLNRSVENGWLDPLRPDDLLDL